jgi:hypothetical protein
MTEKLVGTSMFLKVVPSVIGYTKCGTGNINPGPILTNKRQPLINAAVLHTVVATCSLFTSKTHVINFYLIFYMFSVTPLKMMTDEELYLLVYTAV